MADQAKSDVKIPSAAGDKVFKAVTGSFAFVVLIVMVGAAASMFAGGWPALQEWGPWFFISTEWDPVNNEYGAAVAIYGTLVTSLIAILFAVPISFGIALFISELAPAWAKTPLGSTIELLAAIPSIIYGMWGLFVFAPIMADYVQPFLINTLGNFPVIGVVFQGVPMGIGTLTAGIILAIMIIPFISSIMRDVFMLTPPMLKESAYGLGATTWEVVLKVVLPYTSAAVVGGIFLGLGRALGETMAVTFVIGNAHKIQASIIDPSTSIAATLANEFQEAQEGLHQSSLMLLGFTLFIITFVVLAAAKYMLMRIAAAKGETH